MKAAKSLHSFSLLMSQKFSSKCPCWCCCSSPCSCTVLLPCSIHAFILSCMCVYFCHCSKLLLFFLSAVHLSSVARPKPIFASSWWQRGGDCQGGWPCVLGKRRYRDLHKALAALWGQISRRVIPLSLQMCVMVKMIPEAPVKCSVCCAFFSLPFSFLPAS